VNRDEAKSILLLYRPGLADVADPQMAEALALAGRDPELKAWLAEHDARQSVLREKFRQITAPAGLKEQIISEQAASDKIIPFWHRKISLAPALAVVAVILLSVALASLWFANHPGKDDTLAVYQDQMAGIALRGYAMDLMTNDPAPVRAYLAQNHAPADFVLPENLKPAELVGCAVEGWQDVKVAMICFRSSHARPDAASDLWLFVVDRAAVKKSSAGPVPQFSAVNRLMTATWISGDKLSFLGTTGDAQAIQQYL
jgi:hypothetical protein